MKRGPSADLLDRLEAGALAKPTERPSPVAVYLQAKPSMATNLRAVLRLLGEDPATIRTFPWHELRYEYVSAIRTLLVDAFEPAYARKGLVAVRGVLRVAWKMGLLDHETMAKSVAVDPVKGDSAPAGRMLSPVEVRRMLDATGTNFRDGAILALAVYGGLRREEIADLALASVALAEDGTTSLDVLGKGSKRRVVFMPPVASRHLAAWLTVRGPEPGPLFWRGRKGGKLSPGRRLSKSGVGEVIARAAVEAKVENVTPHDFRRTFASTLFGAGVDPVTVQHLMGHDDPKTTARYDRRPDDAKKAAAGKLARAFEER